MTRKYPKVIHGKSARIISSLPNTVNGTWLLQLTLFYRLHFMYLSLFVIVYNMNVA